MATALIPRPLLPIRFAGEGRKVPAPIAESGRGQINENGYTIHRALMRFTLCLQFGNESARFKAYHREYLMW